MKKLLFLIILIVINSIGLIAQNLDSINQYTGWDESNPLYKIQKLSLTNVHYSKILGSGDKLFTADNNKYFRIWDLKTGKLLFWRNVGYQIPITMLNDSLVAFRGINYSTNFNPIVLYNLNLDTVVGRTKDMLPNESYYQDICYAGILLAPDNHLYISVGFYEQAYPYHRVFTSGKYRIPSLEYDSASIYPKEAIRYLFLKDTSIYLYEYVNHTYDYYNSSFTGFAILKYKNKNNVGSFKIDYSGQYHRHNCQKQLNPSENKCFLLFDKNLHIFDFNDFTKPKIYTFQNNIFHFIVDSLDNFIYYNAESKEITKFKYQDNTYYPLNLGLNVGNSFILSGTSLKNYLLVPQNGTIVQLNNEKVFIEKPNIKADRTSIIENQDINFQISSLAEIKSALWDFGDGKTSTELNPQHIYLDTGSFTVTLITNNGVTSDTVVSKDLIKVEKVYYPEISADRYYGIAPMKVKFFANPETLPNGIIPQWYINGASIGYQNNNFENIFEQPGDYKILMKFSFNGKNYSDFINIRVFDQLKDSIYTISQDFYPSTFKNGVYTIKVGNGLQYLGFNSFMSQGIFNIVDGEIHRVPFSIYYKNSISNSNAFSSLNIEIIPFTKKRILCFYAYDKSCDVRNSNKDLIFNKNINLNGKKTAVLNRDKYFGIYDNTKLVIMDNGLETFSTIYFEKFTGNIEPISDAKILDNVDYYLDSYILTLYQKDTLRIIKFNLKTEFVDSVVVFTPNLKKIQRNSKGDIFIFHNDKLLTKYSNELKFIENYDISKFYPFDDLIIVEDKILLYRYSLDEMNFKIYDTKLNLLSVQKKSLPSDNSDKKFLRIIYMSDRSLIYSNFDVYKEEFTIEQLLLPALLDDFTNSYKQPKEIMYSFPFPNPSDDFINLEADSMENARVEVYNILGTLVPIDYSKTQGNDKDLYRINLSLLPKGVYYYKITGASKIYTGKFIKE